MPTAGTELAEPTSLHIPEHFPLCSLSPSQPITPPAWGAVGEAGAGWAALARRRECLSEMRGRRGVCMHCTKLSRALLCISPVRVLIRPRPGLVKPLPVLG